jgi:hypothetical protein
MNTRCAAAILFAASSLSATSASDTRAVPQEQHPTKIWLRTGPLGETPKHVTDA